MSVSIHGTGTIIGIDQGIQISGVSTFSNNVSIGGTLTYEDVTNVDSIGIITARSGINAEGGSITSKNYIFGAISTTISDTATDIFVYDTSKDSDGGAWRKRTQHTSWYNETLNTSTRGSRKEFPAVAVIVAESNSSGTEGVTTDFTIYDGDDPDLPMWMEYRFLLGSGNNTSVSALNGRIVLSATNNGILISDFIADTLRIHNHVHRHTYSKIYPNRLGRTAQGGPDVETGVTGYAISSEVVNEVAMTVLPSAPIDDATGLPVPTIAVATGSGLSVIKDDGNVYNDTSTSGVNAGVASVEFVNDTLYYGRGGAGGNLYIKTSIGSVSANFSASHYYRYQAGGYGEVSGVYHNADGAITVTKNKNDVALFGDTSLVLLEDKTTSSLVAYATTSHNTGWMHGDIKGAFLSDTDDTNLVEGDILGGKGTFDDASYWTAGSSWTVSGGVATSDSSGISYLTKNGILTTGARYVIRITVSSYSAGTLYVYCGTGAPGNANHYLDFSANGTYTMILDAYNTNFGLYGANFGGVVDNVTISSVVDQDHSVNAKDLGVLGTVTRSAVATGADLVAYSGWSNDNYLLQPHNTDMQTGTGSFSVTAWFNTTTTDSNYQGLIYYNRPGSLGEGWQIMLDSNTGTSKGLYFYVYGPTNDHAGTPITGLNNGAWHQVVATHTNGTQQFFIDGVLRTTGGVTTGSINDSQAQLHIGRWYGNTSSAYYFRGSLALVRHSATIPSAEQIKKIYEDEKHLFQENAKATLYGSSDAVTALGYDEDTELLHVGTSSGRSDFQGLRRINNTTTAVTTAISAHDEFIAEQ